MVGRSVHFNALLLHCCHFLLAVLTHSCFGDNLRGTRFRGHEFLDSGSGTGRHGECYVFVVGIGIGSSSSSKKKKERLY